MRKQSEKNMEKLLEEIERLSEQPITDSIAEHLSVYMGAYKAICMAEKEYVEPVKYEQETAVRSVELDGDTEFEKLVLQIPYDTAHMKAVLSIFSDHMESLAIMNKRAYENVMNRIREVARA